MDEFRIAFWATLTQMSPYLLFGFLVAGVLSVFISPEFVERHLGGHGIWPLLKASLFGIPLPLCSCGVIPVTMSLRKHGASKGAAIAFLLSTPQTGVDSILVTYGLLGPVYAIFRPVAALVTGLVGGAMVTVVDPDKGPQQSAQCNDACCADKDKSPKIIRVLRYGFATLPRDIGKSMLVGLLIAAVIAAVIPEDFFAPVLGGGILAMIVMMLLGIPVYVCATASVPVAVALISKGVSPGAALVFLMTGPATNAAAFTTIWASLGKRTALTYLATVAGSAMAAGLFLDRFFPDLAADVQAQAHEMAPSALGNIAAVVLLGILGWAIFSKKGSTH
ncbi:MAG: permease [Planctomycetota bacterium]|nr:MAG: permease [Planctomycetota bacterium]